MKSSKTNLQESTEKKVSTNWTSATTEPEKALLGLVSCLEAGKNAWIEIRKNGDQAFPIMKSNPKLDNPFNWEMMYGTPRNIIELEKHKYFNETEKDLTYNWTCCYGEAAAIEEYQKTGKISAGMFKGIGIGHPVKIQDVNAYRKQIGKPCDHSYWATFWKPKEGISYKIVDESIGDVFTICFDEEPVDKIEALRKAGRFLQDYADYLSRAN